MTPSERGFIQMVLLSAATLGLLFWLYYLVMNSAHSGVYP